MVGGHTCLMGGVYYTCWMLCPFDVEGAQWACMLALSIIPVRWEGGHDWTFGVVPIGWEG
jgi:hypothetical protein